MGRARPATRRPPRLLPGERVAGRWPRPSAPPPPPLLQPPPPPPLGLRLISVRVLRPGRGAKGTLSVTARPAALPGARLLPPCGPRGGPGRGRSGRRAPRPAPGRPLRPFRAAPQPRPAPHADVGRQMKGFRCQINVSGKESYQH